MGLILANPPRPVTRESCTKRVWDAPTPLRLWHLASLDAPTVAVTWGWAFAWSAHVALPRWTLLLLGLVVWAIYIGDRLLDALPARRNQRHFLQERHYFHWRHRRILAPIAAVAGVAALWLVGSRLSGAVIGKDSLVAAAALAYFSGVHTRGSRPAWIKRLENRIVSREFVVGVIFSAGCILPVLSVRALRGMGERAVLGLIAEGLFFAMLARLNVRAIGHWESFASNRRTVRAPALILSALGLALALGSCLLLPRMAALFAAGAACALLLGFLDRSRTRLTPLALRIAADAVLLAPLVLAVIRPGAA